MAERESTRQVTPQPGEADGGAAAPVAWIADRYEIGALLATGGAGEVYRVTDHKLGREHALKLLRRRLVPHAGVQARFRSEVEVTAQLQHPGIVAVHDRGVLADGRPWYTMKEVRGRTLDEVVSLVHAASADGAWREAEGWSLRRLLEAFLRICEAMAYAHSRGVIHRDLKPSNLMVGPFGEVFVMDWGLGLRLGHAGEVETGEVQAGDAGAPAQRDASGDPRVTPYGAVLGTPAFMAPEQAAGQRGNIGPATDVYALGAVLHYVLSGGMADLRADPAPDLPLDDDLLSVCRRCLAPDPGARFPDADGLSRAVREHLEGARRQERALRKVADADTVLPRVLSLRTRADQLERDAEEQLAALLPFDPVPPKERAWARLDEAARLRAEAAAEESRWLGLLHAALGDAPALPEAHERLAGHYRSALQRAERRRQTEEIPHLESQLAEHDRGQHAAFLGGTGAVSLVTDPPGAEVELWRYERRGRRLVAVPHGPLGRTPLAAHPLPQGSYLLHVKATGFHPACYPVLIERGVHWDGVPPGAAAPQAITLLPLGSLDEDELYVPPGPFVSGGDPDAADGLPRCPVWVDGFVVRRHPVTERAFLGFLNTLVASGRHEEAAAAAPRMVGGVLGGKSGPLAYKRDPRGRYSLRSDALDGYPVERALDRPAVLVDWWGARAFLAWQHTRDNRHWRLPNELEWEKAARGVDARYCPWGDHFEHTWACVLNSRDAPPTRVPVDDFPEDVGPYGMRGAAGNVRDWCENAWTRRGPAPDGGRLLHSETLPGTDGPRSIRGGAWSSIPRFGHCATRFADRPGQRNTTVGFRSVRSV